MQQLSQDPLFALNARFKADPRPDKLNLGIGIFQTEDGQPFVMPSVQKAARALADRNNDYLPIGGSRAFLSGVESWLFDDSMNAQLAMQSTAGGTNACWLFGEIAKKAGIKHLLIGEPYWGNYNAIYSDFDLRPFSHLTQDGNPDLAACISAIEQAPEQTAILLQAGGAHNPTGKNLAVNQLEPIIAAIKIKKLPVFLDAAYVGLGLSLQEDLNWIRAFFNGLEDVALGISFSKIATLYGHRTGALLIKTSSTTAIESQLQAAMRRSISNPPMFGQLAMEEIFAHSIDAWMGDLNSMAASIDKRRNGLIDASPELEYLRGTSGLFGLLKLTREQIERLRSEFGIYVTDAGRINFAGIQPMRIRYISEALESIGL